MILNLYHYTDEKGFHAIKRERVIRAGEMTKYGRSVYLSDLNPEEYTREEVAEAIYQGGAWQYLERGRLDYHIPIRISSHEVQKERDHVYMYPFETLHLDKDSTTNAAWNGQWNRLAMVVGRNALAVAPMVVTGGSAVAVTRGVLAAVRLAEAACWFSNRLDHQSQRTHELELNLTRILKHQKMNGIHNKYATKRVGSDGVCISCNLCQKPVTDVYQGGVLWATNVDPQEVVSRLFKHEQEHLFITGVLTVTAVVIVTAVAAVCICGVWWCILGAWWCWSRWPNYLWDFSFSGVAEILTVAVAMWLLIIVQW